MGQYYTPTIKTEGSNFATFYSHDFDNGLKLMEHSYVGNNFVAVILNYINQHGPAKLWWIGDYAEPFDFAGKEITFTQKDLDKINSHKFNVSTKNANETWNNYVIVNLTKKQYIDLSKYEIGDIFPLSILTSVGNGRGGGDYFGDNVEFAGFWAGDEFDVYSSIPSEEGYTEFTLRFEERY